jgi:D-alanyl-lipoteichoic acid acyltransferase DltB (MBOAT superfamily)
LNWILYISIFLVGIFAYYKTAKPKLVLIILSISILSFYSYQAVILVLALSYTTYLLQSSKKKAWLGIAIQLTILIAESYFFSIDILFKLGLSYYGLQNIGILLTSIRRSPQNLSFQQILISNIFFPKFILGPISTSSEIRKFKPNNTFDYSNIYLGINRILFGLFKKLVLADNLTTITDTVFNHAEAQFKGLTIAIACFLFTIEMYLNFSAYTDIALGVARLFNIKLKDNFNIPLRSLSISEYWQKTHISLIDWLTQNIFYYITYTWRKHPISSTILGITITFTLSGIWHGSKAGFLIWGILNACYLIIEFLTKRLKIKGGKIFKPLSWLITILAISFANLFFRAGYYSNIKTYLSQLFSLNNWHFNWSQDVVAILGNGGYLEQQFNLSMIVIFVVSFLLFEEKLQKLSKKKTPSILYYSVIVLLIFIFGNFNAGTEFIYMQF